MNDENPIADIERENVEAAIKSHEREDDEDHSEEESSEFREFTLHDAAKAGNKESFQVVRDAVENASKGQEPLNTKELAYAISVGLFAWGDQKKVMAEVAKEILEQTGEPWGGYNRAEEYE